MSDQNESSKPHVITSPAANPSPTSAPTSSRSPLLVETFEVLPSPTIDEIVRLMARMANFCNLYAAEALRARIVTASNPSVMAMLNASANLEQGAIAQRQQQAMAAQGQFAAPGQGGPGPGGPMGGPPPFRMN